MFTRLKRVTARGRSYEYLQLVESRWDNGRTHQRIIANLGRLDQLLAKGDLQQVIEGLVKHCPQLKLIEAQRVLPTGVRERGRSVM
jgi:hypothetical protein